MKAVSKSTAVSLLVFSVFALGIVAAISFTKSRTTHHMSIEDKVIISGFANRICKSAGLSSCPIEWGGKDKGFAKLPALAGKPIASLEQVRSVLSAPQWSESASQNAWSFSSGKYAVAVVPGSGEIVFTPLKAGAR